MRVVLLRIGLLLLIVCVVILPGLPVFAAPVPGKTAVSTTPAAKTYTLSPQEQLAVNLLNQARQNEGLELLKVNLQLSKLAADFAQDMRNRKFFAHVDPDGKDPFERMAAVGIDFPNAGENIALPGCGNGPPDVAGESAASGKHHESEVYRDRYRRAAGCARRGVLGAGVYRTVKLNCM